MAQFEFELPEDFLKQLGKLEQVEQYATKMLEESVPYAVQSLKNALQTHNATGELINSISAGKPYQTRNGAWIIQASPKGYSKNRMYYDNRTKSAVISKRKYKLTNAAKLIFMEYGTSREAPRPVVATATKNCESAVMAKMEEVFNREMGVN